MRRLAHGASLIDLMVGLVVAMLVSLAAVGSAQYFLSSQRQSVGASSSTANATTTLAALKNDVANGGLGFFADSAYPCNSLHLGVGPSVGAEGVGFAPVQVARGQAHDRLDVIHGSEVAAGASVRLSEWSGGEVATLRTLLPVSAGQAVLLSPRTPGGACLVRSVTATTAPTAEARQSVTFGASGAHNQATLAGVPVFGENARVALLGQLQWNRYSVKGTDLMLTRVLDGAESVLLRHVIGFRVQYGVSAAEPGSPTLDAWEEPADAFASVSDANIARVRALRIGLVVRSPQREKPNSAGQCEATTSKPMLFGQPVEPDVADWQCYRYRSATIVAPLRNFIYGLKAS